MNTSYKIKKISGDASFREFYRITKKNKSSILVYAKKEQFKNLIVYSAVNKILNNNNISAPKLLKSYYKDNIIEISDLGKLSFYNYIKNYKNKLKAYKKLVELIIKLQNIKLKKNYNFNGKTIKFDDYSLRNLNKESDLFFDWYLKYTVKNKQKNAKIKKILKKELNVIYKKIYFKNNFFTHRDFHASNIMISGKKLSIIDSQDAIRGNPLYDLASLIDDVRIKLPKKLKDKLFNYYCYKSKFKNINETNLKNDFDILSVQRNLKILGIFVRLYKRDNKPIYLKYLPNTWKLIIRRFDNPIFKNLFLLMKKNLSLEKLKKIRKI